MNDKAVIYSDTGSVHAQSFYFKDTPDDSGNSNEVRFLTKRQSYENVPVYVPNLLNFDGYGGREPSEMMITSTDQTVTGKKIFQNYCTAQNPINSDHISTKGYVDGEISKISSVDTNQFVKKTGDTMTGDLILQQQSYPVQGNTDKAVSYNTTRSIFLSRKEGGAMETDINMNNNFIQNVATPTSSHQATNKGYCDYNFLSRQRGGRIMGSLSMNQIDLFEIPAPKYGSSAANKNYVDGEISKITTVDTNQFILKSGSTMTGDLNMNNHLITNVKKPTSDTDVATKGYIDNTLAESHLTSSHQSNEFKYLDDPNDTSSEYNITVDAFTDFNESPHRNKKAFQVSLQKDAGTNNYRSRMGFNLFPLLLGIYTMIFEYYFPENTNIQLSGQATTAYIHKQVQKDFTDYSKLLVQINNNSKTTPDYIYFTIHGTAVVSNPEGYIIVYGVKDWSDSVKSDVYDSDYYQTIFKYKNGDMQMQTNIDLNNHKIKNVPQAMDPTDLLTKQSIKIFYVSLYGTIDQHNYFTNHGVSIGFDSIYIVKIT